MMSAVSSGAETLRLLLDHEKVKAHRYIGSHVWMAAAVSGAETLKILLDHEKVLTFRDVDSLFAGKAASDEERQMFIQFNTVIVDKMTRLNRRGVKPPTPVLIHCGSF